MWGFFHGWKYSLINSYFKSVIFRVFENELARIDYKYTPADTGFSKLLMPLQTTNLN